MTSTFQQMHEAMLRLDELQRGKRMVLRVSPQWVEMCMATFGYVPTIEELMELTSDASPESPAP